MAFLDDLRATVANLQDPQGPAPAPAPPPVAVPTTVPSAAPNAPPAGVPTLNLPAFQAAPEHKGMFGLHGTLRDIVGMIGDAFLVNSGHNPQYGPERAQERESDALQGFVQNPMAAIQRLIAENPREGTKLYGDVLSEQRQNRIADAQYEGLTLNRAMQLLHTANKDNYPQVKGLVQNYVKARGVSLPFDLPDQYDEKSITDLVNTAVPVGQLTSQELKAVYQGRRLDIMDASQQSRAQHYENEDRQGDARVAQGATRTQNDTRRTDQGDTRVRNDTTRTNDNTTRTQNDTTRVGQKQQEIDQYTTGDRGTPMSRRPRPGTIFVKHDANGNPILDANGRKQFGRQVGVDKNGKPIIQPLN